MRVKVITVAAAALLGGTLGTAQASSVSYLLNQSNTLDGVGQPLADGVNYLKVTIDDVGSKINFTVDVLSPLTSIAGTKFGIDEFGFNIKSGETKPGDSSNNAGDWSLPNSNWVAKVAPPDNAFDGFGKFVASVGTNGLNNAISPTLKFSVLKTTGNSIYDYVELSSGNAGQGNVDFSAHVLGFTDQDPTSNTVTSAYFGGSSLLAVPLPAAAWLLVSGLFVLGGSVRRRR